jgi:pyridoxine/pyridoxamine 5'-phosphate oxidase
MTRSQLIAFMKTMKYAVQASIAAPPGDAPQAAVVGVAVSDEGELVFDTMGDTRKAANLRANPKIALVMYEGEKTVQIEGVADEPTGDELARAKAVYFAKFPDGVDREAWKGITYFRVKPTWIRFSDFGTSPLTIVEL